MKNTFNLLLITILMVTSACSNDDDDMSVADCTTVTDLGTKSSLASVVDLAAKATAFKASLSDDNLAIMQYCLNDSELALWAFLPEGEVDREGLRLGEVSASSLGLFEIMMETFLSSQGYDKVDWIINTLEVFVESQQGSTNYGSGYFTVTMFNDPEVDGSWAVQLEGHHLAMTFVVNEDNILFTPTFFGGRPRVHEGTNIFADEESLGLAFVNSLTTSQLAIAKTADLAPENSGYAANKGSNEDRFGDYAYDEGEKTEGIAYNDLDANQQVKLHELIQYYVANYNSDFTAGLLTEIESGLSSTQFVWKGSTDDTNVNNLDITTADRYYYRIYNPALFIEFDISEFSDPADTHHDHFIIRSPTDDFGPFASILPTLDIQRHFETAPHHEIERQLLAQRHGHNHNNGLAHAHHPINVEKEIALRLVEMMHKTKS
ncbi:MAG: DUF3500 domain-containing protein [Reichenbachiella sp.]|uniref:DUF3500 domain-containing protein n=3 Tax=Reichenbachiella sp. TaxID=2184521 RepID=UPI003267BB6B